MCQPNLYTCFEIATNATFTNDIISDAVNMAMHCFWRPIMIGYDSIEGYMPLLKLFICVSAMLQHCR